MKIKFAYISAQRIGHELLEILIHHAYCLKNNYRLIIILSPNVPNKHLKFIRNKNLKIIPLSRWLWKICLRFQSLFSRILGKKVWLSNGDKSLGFNPETFGIMFNSLMKSNISKPFLNSLDDEYFNYKLLKEHHLPFTLDKNLIKKAERIVEINFGIKRSDEEIYCLHIRDNKYTNQRWDEYRNINIFNYKPTIDYIISQGGKVVLMGTEASNKPQFTNQMIDYAHSGIQSPMLDLYFCWRCKGFIGNSSGICLLPSFFAKPVLFLNVYPYSFLGFTSRNMTLFKKVYNKLTNEYMTLESVLSAPHLCTFIKDDEYEENGLKIIENSSTEILDAFKLFNKSINDGSIEIITEDDQRIIDFIRKKIFEREGGINYVLYADAISKLVNCTPLGSSNFLVK